MLNLIRISALLLKACHSVQYPLEGYKKQETTFYSTSVTCLLNLIIKQYSPGLQDKVKSPVPPPWG